MNNVFDKKEIDEHYFTTMNQTYDIVKLVDEALPRMSEILWSHGHRGTIGR